MICEHKPLKHGPVEVISVALLDTDCVITILWTQLFVISDENELLSICRTVQ